MSDSFTESVGKKGVYFAPYRDGRWCIIDEIKGLRFGPFSNYLRLLKEAVKLGYIAGYVVPKKEKRQHERETSC